MKSFFSCIPRKKIKSKNCVNKLEDGNKTSNNKPIDVNNSNSESHIDKTDSLPVEHVNHTDGKMELVNESFDEEKKIIELKLEQEKAIIERKLEQERKQAEDKANEEKQKILCMRLNNALLRIENVSNVLDGKYPGYQLSRVIDQFDGLLSQEFHRYLVESHSVDCLAIESQSELVAELFQCHRSILTMIHERRPSDEMRTTIDELRRLAVAINGLCGDDDHWRELNRLIADSIVIFGWVNVLERPALFVERNVEGYLITVTRLLNDHRFANYLKWLKCWAVFLKRFSVIIKQNFKAALMWGLYGPVHLDVLQCLIECNYSRLEHNSMTIGGRKPKDKVIKTTTVDDMTNDAMTSLMDDLRSGRHKTRLRPTKTDTPDSPHFDKSPHEKLVNGVEEHLISEDSGNGKSVEKVDYHLASNTWILDSVRDQSDIELLNKSAGNSVLISNCHNCSIQVEGVLGAIKLDRSSMINLIIDDVTGPFEVVDSTGVESQVFGSVAKVRLDNVSQLKLFIPLNCAKVIELVSSRSSDVEMYVSKSEEGGLELDDYDKFPVEMNCRSTISGSHISSKLF